MKTPSILFVFAWLTGCGDDGADTSCEVDAPWSCEEEVDMITQAECGGTPDGEATFSLRRNDDEVSLEVARFGARCAQELCAFAHRSSASVAVVIQPCDLHPKMVTRCSCAKDLTIPLGVVEKGIAVEVYERDDEYTMPTNAKKVTTLKEM